MRLIIIPFDDNLRVIENDILEIESSDLNKISKSLNYIMKDKPYQIEIYKNIYNVLNIQVGNIAAFGNLHFNKKNYGFDFKEAPYENAMSFLNTYIQEKGEEIIIEKIEQEKKEREKAEKEKYLEWKKNYKPNLKKERRKNTLLNLAAVSFVGILITLIYFFWIDDIKFFNKRVSKTKGVVVEAKYYHFSGGYYKQKITYEFIFDGKTYTNTFNAGRREGKHNLGDSVLVKFATYNPKVSRYLKTERNE